MGIGGGPGGARPSLTGGAVGGDQSRPPERLSEYEQQRLKTIAKNRAQLLHHMADASTQEPAMSDEPSDAAVPSAVVWMGRKNAASHRQQ